MSKEEKILKNLKEEIKENKERAKTFNNPSYAAGFISALTIIENYLAIEESEDKERNGKI